jgi:hypothetical protein
MSAENPSLIERVGERVRTTAGDLPFGRLTTAAEQLSEAQGLINGALGMDIVDAGENYSTSALTKARATVGESLTHLDDAVLALSVAADSLAVYLTAIGFKPTSVGTDSPQATRPPANEAAPIAPPREPALEPLRQLPNKDLLELVQQGDEAATKVLVERGISTIQDVIDKALCGRTISDENREELIQLGISTMLEKINTEDLSRPGFMDRIRSLIRRVIATAISPDDTEPTTPSIPNGQTPGKNKNDVLQSQGVLDMLGKILTGPQARVMELRLGTRDGEAKTYDEIAAILAISPGAAREQVLKARRSLRRAVERGIITAKDFADLL